MTTRQFTILVIAAFLFGCSSMPWKKDKKHEYPSAIAAAFKLADADARAALTAEGIEINDVKAKVKTVPADARHSEGWSLAAAFSPTGFAGGVRQGNLITMPHNPNNPADITVRNLAAELIHVYSNLPDGHSKLVAATRRLPRR